MALRKRQNLIWLQVVVLLAMFGLAMSGIRRQSPTFDEQGFLTRGVAYLRGANQHIRVGHPLGLNALNALFPALDEEVALPVDDPAWQGTGFHRPSELFLWEIGNDVDRIIFLGRLPTIWLGLLMAALAGRWAGELSGRRSASLLALLMLAFDPNVLAHMRLATTDLGLALAALLAGLSLWRYLQRPTWRRAVVAGIAFGLLQNTKFTAGLFLPLFALVVLITLWSRPRAFGRRPLLLFMVCYPTATFLTLWGTYGFQIGPLPNDLPVMPQLSGLTLPLSHHLEQLADIGGRLQKATPSFLLGHYSDSGWWYYFPVAFALKTSLPALLLIGWAFWRLGRCLLRSPAPGIDVEGSHARDCRPSLADAATLLVPALGYFAFAMTTDINLGYRHLLPILPFLYVLVAAVLAPVLGGEKSTLRGRFSGRAISVALLAWLVAVGWWIRPHFLAYFNFLAGGPDGGWRYLVDSNIDWGQDLEELAGWMEENGIDHVWLSYFGEARPDYYGIDYTGLDSFPPRLMNPSAQPYYPYEPAPGIYAISATNLQGVHFQDHDRFAWFRGRRTLDKVGYTIFLYDVPAFGRPASVSLGGLQLEQILPEDFTLWQTNDVTPHWFDPGQSLLLPKSGWLVLAVDAVMHPRLAQTVAGYELAQARTDYRIYRLPTDSPTSSEPLVEFTHDGETIALQEATLVREGGSLIVETRWLRGAPPLPIKIFVHLTGESGEIISQWDGLGPAWEGWREDDLLLQVHTLPLNEGISPGLYDLWVGLYDPGTFHRWTGGDGDRYLLDRISLNQE